MKVKNEELNSCKKNKILEAAKLVLKRDGFEGLSIRKIAKEINQTPGIIYHYYKDKDEILSTIVEIGYGRIVKIVQESQNPVLKADAQLTITLKSYITGMLEDSQLYKIIMNLNIPEVKAQTHLLEEGLSGSRRSLQMLCGCIQKGNEEGIFTCANVELRAQSIWCCIFGLIDRCISEEPSKTFKERLIDEHLRMIIQSLR